MNRTKEKIEKSITTLLKDLDNIAMEDQVVSNDEKAIIEKIHYDLRHLEKQIVQILESDLDEHEFQEIFNDSCQDIIDNTIKVAESDGKITEDENKLLKRIQEFISQGGVKE